MLDFPWFLLFFCFLCPLWTENNDSSHCGSGWVCFMAGSQHTQTCHVFRWADTVIGAVVWETETNSLVVQENWHHYQNHMFLLSLDTHTHTHAHIFFQQRMPNSRELKNETTDGAAVTSKRKSEVLKRSEQADRERSISRTWTLRISNRCHS